MGVGMNEVSKLTTAIGAAGVAAKMVGDTKEQAIDKGLAASISNAEDEALAEDLQKDKPLVEGAADLANDNYEVMRQAANDTFADPKATPDQRLAAMVNEQQALDDRTAAQKALKELNVKLTAAQERMARQKSAIERGRAWGGKY